jgi:hypothetical protein
MHDPYRKRIGATPEWDPVARAHIEPLLQDGEELLWCGRPWQGFRLVPMDIVRVPFSIMWGGFAIFWETMVLVGHAPLLFRLWGIPFVAVGLYIMIGRFFLDRARRRRTYYGLTSRRALIVRSSFGRSCASFHLATATQQPFELKEHGGGRGTIRLGPTERPWGGMSFWGIGPSSSLESIESARAVYDKLIEAQRAALEPAATRSRVAPLRGEQAASAEVEEEADEEKRSTS